MFGGTLPLFLFVFTLIEQTYIILNILLVEHHFCCHCFPLGRGPPLVCRPEIRTRKQAGALLSEPHRTKNTKGSYFNLLDKRKGWNTVVLLYTSSYRRVCLAGRATTRSPKAR